jgi:serine/threonine-protein kinase
MPRTIGQRYEVLRTLGVGPLATVYSARDLRLGREVAVKLLNEEFGSGVTAERFEREIAVQEQLQHPNIVPLLDRGIVNRSLFFVMPIADEGTLEQRLRFQGALGLTSVRQLLSEIADALQYAHDRGVVHRDVKPSNILITGGHYWLCDFGIVRLAEVSEQARLTPSGITIGSPQYMSPEQLVGDSNIDSRSDIYSLGLVLYEAVAGVPAFVSRDAQVSVNMRLVSDPVAIKAHRSDLDAGLEASITRALQRDVTSRWQTVRDMAASAV